MKKTLLSVLAGLTVIGYASAAPTPEDRKALCQLLIDKGTHVWVEKTQAWIPVNPCLSNGEIYNAYCTFFSFPADENNIKTIIDTYTKKLLGVEPIDYKYLDSDSHEDHYYAVKTSDNGYFVANFFGYAENGCIAAVFNSLKANGYAEETDGFKTDNDYDLKDPIVGKYKTQYDENSNSNKFKINVTDSVCEEIRSFASSLKGEQINRDLSSQLCVLVCPR